MTAAGTGPLAGLRVVEMAAIGPVPFACLLLGQLGADVLRIERPSHATADKTQSPGVDAAHPSLVIDLKTKAGRAHLLAVIDHADVVVEGMRPGVMERLGTGPRECLDRNPGLVYARMTGWGQDGPWSSLPGHDINYAAITGALHSVGTRDAPVPPLNLVADFGGGAMYLIAGILAAVIERRRSGRGQVVDAAMVDGVASLMSVVYERHASGHWTDRRQSNLLDGGAPFYGTYECADGRHVAVGAIETQFYSALIAGLGIADNLHGDRMDSSNWAEHRRVISAAFRTRTRDEWAEHFDGTDACVAPVLSLAEAPTHPHLLARGTFRRSDEDDIPRPAPAPRFSRTTTDPVPPRDQQPTGRELAERWRTTRRPTPGTTAEEPS